MSDTVLTAQDVVLKLVALLEEEGQILFSNIPEKLAPIDYKKYSNGKGLKAWLTGMPEFEENETGLALVLAESLRNTGVIAEVRCMHAFSYMNFWAQNVKYLRQLDDTLDIKADPLREHMAHVLMKSLLMGELDIELGESPRLVMNTKIQLSDGNDVYAVFRPNPANTDGTKQYWVLMGFCSLSASDKSDLGNWLQGHLSGSESFDYTDLLHQLDVIENLAQPLQAELAAFSDTVHTGRRPNLGKEHRISILTAEYEAQWETLNTMLQSLPLLSVDGELTLTGIRNSVSKEAFHSTLLKQALEAFGDLAAGVRQFFAKCHWDSGEDCTPNRDYAFLLKKYENGANVDPKLTDFRRILEEYRRFLYVVSFQKSDDHYLEELKHLTDHFPEMPQKLRLASEYLIDFSEEERSFLVGVDDILRLLNQCASSFTETMAQDLALLPESNSQLLKTVLEEDTFISSWPLYLKNVLPEDPAIQKVIVPGEKTRVELTCFAAANRLMKAGHTTEAERYLILGLQYEGVQCAPELLKLYRETGREEDFLAVWKAFSDQIVYSLQDEAFWFGALCRYDPEHALELSRRDIHLQYQSAHLPSLLAVAEETGDETLAQALRDRLEAFRSGGSPNAFEQAIIQDDRTTISAMVQDEQLQTMGYSDKQIQHIREVAETGDFPAGDSAYQIGRRLYAFQGNRNCLAEQWLWQGVSRKNRGSYEDLMLLLANEQRWSEAVRLYEMNEEYQKRFESCRRFYLLCCYNLSSELAQGVFKENLQDALTVLSLSPSLLEKIKNIATEPGNEVYAQLLKLYAAVDTPYLRSLLTEDRALRDHVYDQELLSSLGLDVTVISEAYRNGMYPHGRDAVSVAHRLYALAGNLSSAAEIAAQIAGQDPAAQNLLWNIYSASQNETAQYELLLHNEDLRHEHYAQYLGFLYSRGEYALFLEQMEQLGDMTEELVLRRATAELIIAKPMTDTPKLCAEAAAVCDPDTCSALLQAAASAGASDLVTEILCGCFDKWLVAYPQKLRVLVTCGGEGNGPLYELIQETALERNILTLAVYIQNVLEIGNAQTQSEALYLQLQTQLRSGDIDHELSCLHQLQHLYPAQAEDLSVQVAAVSIQALLLSSDPEDKQATVAKLEEIIASFGSNEKMFDIATSLLQGTEYCGDYRLCTALRNYAKLIGRSTEALLFIHRENYQDEGAINPRFRDYLTRMYFNALVENRFPADIAQEAGTLCLQTVRQSGSPQAALTAAMLEQLMGRDIYANAMLNHLAALTDGQADFPKTTLNVLGMEAMPDALQLESPLPSFLDLFEQVMDLGSESGILEFLAFCHAFMPGDIQALQKLRNLKPDQALTEQQSIQAIKLLCSDPDSAVYWEICAHIPFEAGDGGRANFLHLCCQKNPGRWKEYVQLCETLSSASERLSAALALWAQASEDCRMYIEEKLVKHPSYLEDLDDPESLCLLVRSLCGQLNERSLNMVHAQLRAVAQIAVATGEPACLEILRQDAGRLLFGSQRNLGVVVLSRLLLTGRFYEAHAWNEYLAGSLASGNYQTLIDELEQYGPEQLREWVMDPSSKMFLELILPDGNQPNILQVADITAKALLSGTEKETATALMRVLEEFPEDYATAYQLLELCKSGFEDSLPILHFCLVRLSSITSKDNPKRIIKHYDDRPDRSHTISLAILNQLLIHNQQIHLIGEGWDFSCLTAQALDNMGVRVEDPALITAAEQQVIDSLNNQSPDICDLRIQAWMANITGNWTDYLETLFQANTPGNEVFFPPDNIDPLGFSRSVLLLLSRTEPEEYANLLNWLSGLTALSGEKQWQLAVIRKLFESNHIITPVSLQISVVGTILRFPVENGVLAERLVETVLQPMMNQDLETAELVAYMIGALGDRYAMVALYDLAEEFFSKEQDPTAYCLYSVLYHVSDDFRSSHENTSRFTRATGEYGRSYAYKHEEYKMKRRICGAFSGVSEHVRKLGSKDLSPWSIINMVLCLALERADEIWRFETYLTADNVRIAEYVRMYLDRNVADNVKMESLHDAQLPVAARCVLARMLSYVTKEPNKIVPHYLRLSSNSRIVKAEFDRLSEELKGYEKLRVQKIALLCKGVTCLKVDSGIRNQRDPSYWDRERSKSAPKEVITYHAPDYISELPLSPADPERLNLLKEQYQKIATGTYGHFSEKARLSSEIYSLVIGGDLPAEECYRALLRYSVDRFYELLSDGTQSSRGQAFRMLLTLLETGFGGIRDGAEYDALVEMVNAVGAAGLLKSYTQIQQLAKSYDEHKSAFAVMRSLIADKVIFRDMGIIYEVLDKLAKDFAQVGTADTDKLIQALRQADSRIGYTDSSCSAAIRNQLQRMIRSELTALTRRARLEIRLLNQGVQSRTGYLTGFVYNKGTVKAEKLRLQVFYGIDNSEQYGLEQLMPNEKAIFEIPYECGADNTQLTGYLDLMSGSSGEQVGTQCQFSLELGVTSGSSLPYNAYSPDRPRFVFNPETKTVESANFFGRSEETARMRELIAEERFADFHSAVVYGVRRTGKTSLLEYFRHYVRGTRPDCLCIRIDVQSTDETIRSVFVSCVLQEPLVLEALEHCSERDIFVQKWTDIVNEGVDMDPNLITVFFRELYQLTGKGMILIVDEIDRLFKSIEDNRSARALNNLLSALSGLLDNDDRREYLQLVICGSNWLMYYVEVGHDMQQVFQRFGDYKISVGRLPKDDVMDLLSAANIQYAEGTKEMIWEYTGGLVWFVKLLGNAAIRRAKMANREWVYPADVFFSLNDVVTEQNCKQFYEGCNPGTLERQMIDAMQSRACRKGMYLSLDTICELLDKDYQEIEQVLKRLILLEIVERNPVRPDMVRFRLDIYRRYFRIAPSSFRVNPEEVVLFEPTNENTAASAVETVGETYGDDEEI